MVQGHAGPGVAENMMAGSVRVAGNASQAAGATGNGGLLVIEGDASSRCGISMKGIDIVVGGSVGHMSAFMAQAGCLVVCGDAGEALGDSIYEARLYVARQGHLARRRLHREGNDADIISTSWRGCSSGREINADPRRFRRYGSARKLYNFNIDNADAY